MFIYVTKQIVFQIADSFPGMDPFVQAPLSQQQHQSPVDLRKPPKWLKRPVGASFGVSFTTSSSLFVNVQRTNQQTQHR
jgi:protein transport protein SEC31